MPFETWLVFHNAIKYLDRGLIQKLYTHSTRLFYKWAADPKYCASSERNPIDRIKLMFQALDDAGKGGVVRAAVRDIAAVVGLRLCDDVDAVHAGSIDQEIADMAIAVGEVGKSVRSAKEDGVVDTAERIRIHEAIRALEIEVKELAKAAGIE